MPKISNPVSSSSFENRGLSRGLGSSPYSKSPNPYKKDEWKEVNCPICFDHPHNAVLLICSSHDKGCRPYMCNTSHRHSNCLDQFCKLHSVTPLKSRTNSRLNKFVGFGKSGLDQLVCPYCRGEIKGWVVEQDARRFMNLLVRNCASESCEFSGKYGELRKHARLEHPSSRPSFLVEADHGQSQAIDQFDPYFHTTDIAITLQDPSRDRWKLFVGSSCSCGVEDCYEVGNVKHVIMKFVRGAEFYVQIQINGRIVADVSGVI